MVKFDYFIFMSFVLLINVGVYFFSTSFSKRLFSLFSIVAILLLVIDLRVQESIILSDGLMFFIYIDPLFLLIGAIYKEFTSRQGEQ